MKLCNDISNVTELLSKKKQLVIYGAGASAKLLLASYYEEGLKDCVKFIVDQNESLDGTYCVIDDDIRLKIISLKHFCRDFHEEMNNFTLLFSPYYTLHFIKQLNEMTELDDVEAYIFSLIVNKKEPEPFQLRSLEHPQIPRILHYFWIGEEKMPEEYRRNIETWKRFCPDYEIMEWNETNYDFGKYRFAKEALENKQYMYATDLARKDVLYTYGGIYLDTDVEMLKSIDDLLYNEAFIGIDDGGQLNSGSGLGAVEQHPMIKDMLDIYQDKTFVREDGNFNLFYNTYYETKYMIDRGYRIRNEYQKIGGMVCFPREVFMPEGVVGLYDNYTEKTLINHKINPCDKTECRKIIDELK